MFVGKNQMLMPKSLLSAAGEKCLTRIVRIRVTMRHAEPDDPDVVVGKLFDRRRAGAALHGAQTSGRSYLASYLFAARVHLAIGLPANALAGTS